MIWLDPLDGLLVGVQHELRLKLFLLGIFVKDFCKDMVLELAELLNSRKHGHTVSPLLVVCEEMNELAVFIIFKFTELVTLKLDALEAHICPGFQEGIEEALELSSVLVLLEVVFDLLLACILSF